MTRDAKARRPEYLQPVPPPYKDPQGRPAPHDKNLELGILATIISKPDAVELVLGNTTPDDFYDEAARELLRAILHHVTMGMPFPVWALKRTLERTGKANLWPHTTLEQLPLALPNVPYLDRAVARIRSLARQRAMNEHHWRALCEGYEQHDNIDEWIDRVAGGAEAIAMDTGAKEMSELGAGVTEYVERLSNREVRPSLVTGIGPVDRLVGGIASDVAVFLGARPGVGKTALALDVGCNIAGTVDPMDGLERGVYFASAEMSKTDLNQRALSRESRVPVDRIRNGIIHANEWPEIYAARERIEKRPIVIDETKEPTPRHIRGRARALDARWRRESKRKLALVVIDYLQLLDGRALCGPRAEMAERIDACAAFVARLPDDLGVPVICLARMKRTENARPTAEDFWGSSGTESHADEIWILHEDKKHERIDLDVPKARSGRVGRGFMSFDRGRFSDYDRQARLPAVPAGEEWV